MTASLDRLVARHVGRIQPHIAYCYNCQPYEGGEPVWIFGDRTDLEDVLNDFDVREELHGAVSEGLSCQNCGTPLSQGEAVGLKTELELLADKRWRKWHDKYQPRVQEFQEFLERFPYLGMSHRIGRKLSKTITDFPKTRIADASYWRARRVQDGRRLRKADLLPPKHPKAEGRYNHYGHRALYLASSKEGALEEALKDDDHMAWMQACQVQGLDHVLNLTRSPGMAEDSDVPILALGLIAGGDVLRRPSNDSPWKPEYFVPRFIADCARHHGFKGILFNSPKHYDDNLVLFEWEGLVSLRGRPRVMTRDDARGAARATARRRSVS